MTNIYRDINGEIEVGSLKLKGLGRDIWLMLDGKHTIGCITNALCHKLGVNDNELIMRELLTVLKMLKKRKIIVVNWDPIYKTLLSQEI